jgi:alpha-tubulin suppressor-like RCC1 family protein
VLRDQQQGACKEAPARRLPAVAPTTVPCLAEVRIRAVACNTDCNLAVSEAGRVFAWGHQLQSSVEQGIGWTKRQPPVPTVMEVLRNYQVRHGRRGLLSLRGFDGRWGPLHVGDSKEH